MGLAMQLVTGFVTNPSTTFTAITVNSGESVTVPAFNPATKGLLGAIWSPGASAGVMRVRSPRMHDNAQNIRAQRAAGLFEPLQPLQFWTPVFPADALTVEITGGAAETDMAAYLLLFDDLPGIAARLAMPSEVLPRVRNLLAVEVDLTSGTVGAYGTARALNFSFDTLKASEDYAVLGYSVSAKVGVVCLYGPDTGNQHVGGPGLVVSVDDTREWFVALSRNTGRPCIPIINSNNRGTTFVQIADVGASTAANVSLFLAELG